MRSRGQEAERAGEDAGFIAQDVAEQILGEQHVERRRIRDQAHGGEVDVQVLQGHVGILPADPAHGVAPELGDLQHVGLVHRGHLAASAPGPRRNATRATRSISSAV